MADDHPPDAAGAEREYGIPGHRDPHTGELRPQEHVYESPDHGAVRLQLIPPTEQEVQAWQQAGNDMSPERMGDILDAKLVKPDIERPYSMTELVVYVNAIADYALDDDSDRAEAIAEALERRREEAEAEAGPGNPEAT